MHSDLQNLSPKLKAHKNPRNFSQIVWKSIRECIQNVAEQQKEHTLSVQFYIGKSTLICKSTRKSIKVYKNHRQECKEKEQSFHSLHFMPKVLDLELLATKWRVHKKNVWNIDDHKTVSKVIQVI